jgi:hypothetical protein
VIAPKALPQPQPRRHVRARDAARRRARRRQFHGYGMLARIALGLVAASAPVMLYVMLTANLTGLSFSLEHLNQQKVELQAETQRLDDRIAQLESRDRLAAVAAKLKMHDPGPTAYAVVELPRPAAPAAPGGIAFLGSLFRR